VIFILRKMEIILAGRYQLNMQRIGSGAFGSIYQGKSVLVRSRRVMSEDRAVGCHQDGRLSITHSFSRRIRRTRAASNMNTWYYQASRASVSTPASFIVGVPKVHWYGEEAGSCILVMELLDYNIEQILHRQTK